MLHWNLFLCRTDPLTAVCVGGFHWGVEPFGVRGNPRSEVEAWYLCAKEQAGHLASRSPNFFREHPMFQNADLIQWTRSGFGHSVDV